MSSPKIRLFISLSSPQSWNPHPSALQYRHPLDQRIRRQSSHKKLLPTKEGLENLLLLENEVIDLIYFLKPQSWRLPTCIRKAKYLRRCAADFLKLNAKSRLVHHRQPPRRQAQPSNVSYSGRNKPFVRQFCSNQQCHWH